ncbi:hypothetical protein FQA47_018027 [Oryzias melastigma]|uniref:Uncharacterized protein n=1 Tax=Oryzias melastigma TaxID=30732 RepID=A0A834C2Z0_ORYME|nr:hypothetical protein FQA47_018027 [Oryzias melastigma]
MHGLLKFRRSSSHPQERQATMQSRALFISQGPLRLHSDNSVSCMYSSPEEISVVSREEPEAALHRRMSSRCDDVWISSSQRNCLLTQPRKCKISQIFKSQGPRQTFMQEDPDRPPGLSLHWLSGLPRLAATGDGEGPDLLRWNHRENARTPKEHDGNLTFLGTLGVSLRDEHRRRRSGRAGSFLLERIRDVVTRLHRVDGKLTLATLF